MKYYGMYNEIYRVIMNLDVSKDILHTAQSMQRRHIKDDVMRDRLQQMYSIVHVAHSQLCDVLDSMRKDCPAALEFGVEQPTTIEELAAAVRDEQGIK